LPQRRELDKGTAQLVPIDLAVPVGIEELEDLGDGLERIL